MQNGSTANFTSFNSLATTVDIDSHIEAIHACITSELYRETVARCGVRQSMNSAGGRCHDNARCESMWARMKTERIYDRYDSEKMSVEELKFLVWRYFLGYWNN